MSARFEGKAAVVTGAAGGIGRATVARLAQEGGNVLAVDLDEKALSAAFPQSSGLVGKVITHAADVTQEQAVQATMARAVEAFGGLDCVFNNAGIEGAVAPIEDYPLADYERVIAVNVTGVFLGIKHAIRPLLARGGGAIVNTASTAGLQGNPMIPAYVASKHAVIGLTRSSAAAHARNGIRINAICPAPIDTRMMRSIEQGMNPDDPVAIKHRFERNIPVGRYGEPSEVAALVAFLLSDEARFINSSVYTIDGGMTPH